MLLTSVLICMAALALLIAVPAYIAFATHNRLVALDQRCDTAFGDVDVHLKHRHNLIPPLVETVRGFAKHENDILLGVTQARAEALQAGSPEMQLSAEQNLTQNINALIGMAERYPDTPIMGHGEVNPGHKEADEGMTAKRAALVLGSADPAQKNAALEAAARLLDERADDILEACRADPTRDAPLVHALLGATDPETGRALSDRGITRHLSIVVNTQHGGRPQPAADG